MSIEKSVVVESVPARLVELAIAKSALSVEEAVLCTDKSAHGVEVPKPDGLLGLVPIAIPDVVAERMVLGLVNGLLMPADPVPHAAPADCTAPRAVICKHVVTVCPCATPEMFRFVVEASPALLMLKSVVVEYTLARFVEDAITKSVCVVELAVL